MTRDDDKDLRDTWQSQLTVATPIDPAALRKRADEFASKASRSVRINQISAGLAAVIAGGGMVVIDGGLLAWAGAAMLLVLSLYMVWAFRYFFRTHPIPANANSESCAAMHKRQLERQRDMNLSARSTGPALLPPIVLLTLSRHWPDAETFVGPEGWGFTIAFIASAYFVLQMC
jgi:hypothetical protein